MEWALAPFLELADNSDSIISGSVGDFVAHDGVHQIPHIIFMGPKGGGETMRIDLFAAIHGDEPEGTEVLAALLTELEYIPGEARGFHLYTYPVCNPSGFVAGTRCNAAGQDLATHFWRGSDQPEVYYLEREIGVHAFQGVLSLHSHDEPRLRFSFGGPHDSALRAALAPAAIQAAQKHLPIAPPEAGVYGREFYSANAGFLTRTDEIKPKPFEINLWIPRHAPKSQQIAGVSSALKAILDAYRAFIATHQNI